VSSPVKRRVSARRRELGRLAGRFLPVRKRRFISPPPIHGKSQSRLNWESSSYPRSSVGMFRREWPSRVSDHFR